MPVEKGGFNSKAIYFNNTDYYVGKSIVDPSTLGMLAKRAGIDPALVFKNVEVASAFNEARQLLVSGKVVDMIREDNDFKLLAVHNITRFLANSKNSKETRETLKKVVGNLWRTASKNCVALVMTIETPNSVRGFVPKPFGGIFIRQSASILVHFKKLNNNPIQSHKVTLVKHPYKRAPESIILYVR